MFNAVPDVQKSEVVGMYIGYITDSNGSKLSRIIPSKVIRAAIEYHHVEPIEKVK